MGRKKNLGESVLALNNVQEATSALNVAYFSLNKHRFIASTWASIEQRRFAIDHLIKVGRNEQTKPIVVILEKTIDRLKRLAEEAKRLPDEINLSQDQLEDLDKILVKVEAKTHIAFVLIERLIEGFSPIPSPRSTYQRGLVGTKYKKDR